MPFSERIREICHSEEEILYFKENDKHFWRRRSAVSVLVRGGEGSERGLLLLSQMAKIS